MSSESVPVTLHLKTANITMKDVWDIASFILTVMRAKYSCQEKPQIFTEEQQRSLILDVF